MAIAEDSTIKNAVHTPAETSKYTQDYIEKLAANQHRAVGLGISAINDYFAPLMSGQLCAVIAQTSHYKSGFFHSWERALALQLMNQGRNDEIVVHISVEETVEEQGILMVAIEAGEDSERLARGQVQDWTKLRAAAIKIGTIPIYRIGDALARPEDMPHLYLSNLIRAVSYMKNEMLAQNPKISAIFVDYLQALPFDPEHRIPGNDQRRLQVRSDIYSLRQASLVFDCPVIVAVQAKQHLDGAPSQDWQMPGVYDGEESSSIAQRSDRVITLWMPKQTHAVGTQIEYRGNSFTVE